MRAEAVTIPADGAGDPIGPGRAKFVQLLQRHAPGWGVDHRQRVLIVGGCPEDAAVLRHIGWRHIINSNHATDLGRLTARGRGVWVALDAEHLALADNSVDVVFTYDVLHHCRSPHRALNEMVRVARERVIFHEPNDSACMRLLERLGLSAVYELPAVFDNGCRCGGVNNSPVPNFVYRWTGREVQKTTAAMLAEHPVRVHALPYWSFRASREELGARRDTHLAWLVRRAGNLLPWGLRLLEPLLNAVAPAQGNKFLCCIEKTARIHPWLCELGGHITTRADYRRKHAGRTPRAGALAMSARGCPRIIEGK
ncbi:MAG: class I SAM-dependent methyltransferase [Terriglobales bacterium]